MQILNKFKRFIISLPQRKKPLKLVAGLLLQRSGLSRYFKITTQHYTIVFHPQSRIALSMWLDNRVRTEVVQFADCVEPSGTVVDIGANIGTFSLGVASRIGGNGNIFAIEPHPKTYQYLQHNIQLNEFMNITAINKAVGDKIGQVHISTKKDDDQNFIVTGDGVAVQATTLDKLCEDNNIGSIALLKIDTEGYEEAVLRGGTRTLGQTDIVYIETNPSKLSMFNASTETLFNILEDAGFSLYYVGDDRRNAFCVRPDTEVMARVFTQLDLIPIERGR